jgi:endonuclease/exonuclease/phosphatase family metal-dependent hydrolase
MKRRIVRALSRAVAMLVLVAVAGWPVGAAGANGTDGHDGSDGPRLGVLTRNLYLGSDLTNLVTATSPEQFVAAVATDWAHVLANDFPRRAKALATEIALTRPDVLGLQEVSQFTLDGSPTPTLDYLQLLRKELVARGMPYEPVSTSTNADVQVPLPDPDTGGLTSLRFIDRDVIMVRSEIADRFSNAQDGHYAVQLVLPTVVGPVSFTRGWTSIDYAIGGQTVRIFNTHLETTDAPPVQVAQGAEALGIINASPYPVIALGDYNSAADGSTTPTYANLIAGGLRDAWTAFQPFNPGKTCCQEELLDTLKRPTERIDLVLTKGPIRTMLAVRTGLFPFRLAPPPLWASDHFGVFALLQLHEA